MVVACEIGRFRTCKTVHAVCDGDKYYQVHDFEACLGELCVDATENHLASVTGLLFKNIMQQAKELLGADVESCVVSLEPSSGLLLVQHCSRQTGEVGK